MTTLVDIRRLVVRSHLETIRSELVRARETDDIEVARRCAWIAFEELVQLVEAIQE